MAISLSDAAKRFGMDIKTEAQDKTAPTALTDEQRKEGLKGYDKYKADIDAAIPSWAKPKGEAGLSGNRYAQHQASNPMTLLSVDASLESPSEQWNEDEKARFGLEYLEKGKEAARSYALSINEKYKKEANEVKRVKISEMATKNFGTGVAASALSVLTAPTALSDYLSQLSEGVIYGRPVEHSITPFSAGQTAREAIGTKLNEYGTIDDNVFMLGGKGLGDVYGLGMSIADSLASSTLGLVSPTLGGIGTLVNFFGQSASRAYEEAYKRGATGGQAELYSVLMGAAEAIPEMISVDKLLHLGKDATKSLLKQVIGQAIGEGGEELTTSGLNLVIDKIVFGESDIGALARQYEASGMSREEAINKAWLDTIGNLAFDAVSGFVSGGVSGSIYAGAHTLSQNAIAKQKYGNGADVAKRTLERVPDSTFAQNMVVKTELGNELTGGEINKLLKTKNDADVESVRLAIANRLMAKGENGKNIPTLTQIILNKALGGEPSSVQNIRLKNSNAAMQVLNEIDATNMLSGNFDSRWAIDAGINKIRDVSGVIQTALAEANKEDVAEGSTTALNLSTEAREALRGKFTGLNSAYTPQSENTHIHTDEIKSTTLDAKQTAQIRAIERVANALGVDFYIYESEYSKKDGRKYVDKDGNVITDSGYYDPRDNSIHIDLHAGQNGEGTMLYTASHELVHWIKKSAADQFEALKEFVLGSLKKEGVQIDTLIEKQINKAKENGRDMDRDGAIEEIVADACMTVLTTDAGIKAVTNLKTENKGLWNALKRFFAQFFNRIDKMYKGVKVDSEEGQYLADMHETAKKLRDLFVEGAQTAAKSSETNTSETKVDDMAQVDASTDSVAPVMHSYRTWTESEYVTRKAATIERISESLGIPKTKVAKYINDINSIAKMIADDHARLDYEASSFGSAFVSNVEYGGSFDYTTLCKKRRIYTGTFSEIQKRLGDVALTPDDILEIRNLMIAEGIEATCGLCYVEGSRANMGKFAKEFIRLYKRDNPDAWIPTMVDVNTPDGVEQMRINHPDAYEQYEYFWNHYGKLKDSDPALFALQQKPKLYEARKEYKGEILKYFKGDMTVAKKNLNGGIRMQSFSDFEIVHLIDTMQVIMDMSTVGLAGQAYTKVPEFAQAFGGTGLKINLSLIAKGVDANGNLIFDDREGMPAKTAFELRDKYSENVGTIIVAFTDEQIFAAMADDRIDFIIPFHRSQWKKGQYGAMGLPQGTKDYTNVQNEKLIKPTYHEYRGRMVKDKATNYMPNEYWDFSKSGKENAEAYLEMCAKNNKRPKFYKFLDYDGNGKYSLKTDGSTDGYWKLLIDFKMYDNNGVGSPQRPVLPDFNMDESIKMLNEYRGGHSSYPVANSVVDKFVESYNGKKDIKHSGRKKVDTSGSIAEFIEEVVSMSDASKRAKRKKKIGVLSVEHAAMIDSLMKQITPGFSSKGYELWIDGTSAAHIEERHGKNGVADHTMASKKSKELIPWAAQNAEEAEFIRDANGNIQRSNRFFDSNGKRAPEIKLKKSYPGGVFYISECVPDSANKRIWITSAYTNKNGSNGQLLNVEKEISPQPTSETSFDGNATTNRISHIDSVVNTPSENSEIKSSARKRITPEMDAYYLDAVNRGDTETAQRLVDEAAREAGYAIKAYHGTRNDFTIFDKTRYGKNYKGWSKYGNGFYFATTTADAEYWAMKAKGLGDKRVMPVYLRMDNPYVLTPSEYSNIEATVGKIENLSAFVREEGYDGIKSTLSHQYVVFDSEQVKSADPITYDDNGNVIPLSERFNSEQSDIRYSSRKKRTVTLSVGEEAKFRANYTRSKVFSKSNMYRIIEKFASKGELSGKTIEELADDMWISFNSATSVEERREFAHSTAQFVVSKLLQESKSQSKEAVAATEQLLYLKGGIRRIDFTPDEITEIRFKKDESGLKSIRARWGYHKSHTNAKVRPYPLDVFVTDVAREVPGMAHLADMNHIDAFFEIADMYDALKAKVKDRWVSNYAETSNSDLDALQMEIEQTIFDAYITEGEQSKFGKFISAKLDAYKERTEYWKAAYDNFKDRARLENLVTYKAQKMEDLKKGTFLNATQYGNADAFRDSIEKLSSLKFRGAIRKPNAVRDIFKPILAWYTKGNPMLIDPKADEASPHKYSYEVAAMLEVIANGENGLSNDELAAIYEIMNYFTKFIETYNKVWRNGKWEDAIGIATTDIEIMQHVAKSNTMSALKRAANKYAELFSEPMFVARMSDGYQNGFFTQTMTELREAAKNAAIAEMEVREDYDKFLKEHPEYVEKASTEMVEFKGVQIPKMQLIGLYMTYHRKHAQAGLIFNGFKFTTQPTKVGEVARTIAIPGATSPNADLSQAEFNALVKMEITLIRSKLNATDKEYIKMLEGLYNGQLRALKVQRDMDRLGFTNATLDYYYPIRRATIAKSIDTTVFEDVNRATNSSFNKNTVKGARQQLYIESADTLINKHIHEICNYAYMSGAIENYNVIYNLDVSGNPNNPVSVRTTIEATNLWTSSQKYFHKLVKDMQGIKSGDDTVINSALGWLRSGYVKFQLGLNLKTIASQASSIYAATSVLDYGSIVKGMGVDATGVDDYCAYAKLRHYDKSAIKAMTVTEKIDKKTEWVTAGIEAMDRLIVTKLFGACQVQAEKNGAGKIGTEENKIAAGKLLEKVILDTQSNALATEKTSAMRSESEVAKMLTMFRADSMKVVTRVFESVGELRMLKANNASETEIKGAQVKVAKSVAALVMVSAFMATLAQLFRWIYNKEQDEDRVLVDVAVDFAGNLLSGVPLLSDLWDYFIDGFEPSSMALDVVFTLAGGVNSITKDLFDAIFSEDKPSRQKIMRDLRTVLYGACQFVGVPVRNVYNMVTGVIGNISSEAEYRIDDFFNENNYYSDLKEAIEKEDLAKVDFLFSLAYGKQFGNSVSDATVEELNRLAKLGKDYRVLPKTIPDKITRDGIEYELTDNQKQDILTQYEKVNAAIDKLITLSSYKSLSDEKKVERLKYYYDKYFDLAVTSALGLAKSNEQLMYSAVGFDTYAKFHFATKGIKSDKDKNGNTISGSKRKKTIQAIDKLKLPEEKRLILIASKGYALTENERSKLVRYINGLKLSATTKNALAELCGLEVKNGKIVNK